MSKLFCLVFVLFTYAPLTVLADCALQEVGWVIEDMQYTELGSDGQYIGYPDVWAVNNTQYVVFSIDTDDVPGTICFESWTLITEPLITIFTNAADVCDIVKEYMAPSVGNASASCSSVDGGPVNVTYVGDYDPTLIKPTGVQALVRVLKNFVDPILGQHQCQQSCFESGSGWSYANITIVLNQADGGDCETACEEVVDYMSSLTQLGNDFGQKCTNLPACNSCFLEIWSSK